MKRRALAACIAALFITLPAGARASVHDDEYESPAVGRKLKCRVILPVGYEAGAQRYPVLYLLHGFSGDFTKWSNHGVEASAKPFPLIVVMPDGANSWYVNWDTSERGWKNGWEDAIVKDLIGHIDGHYRTIPARAGRAINGLSMGGYGAITIGLRHPDLFGSIGSSSGALGLAREHRKTLASNPDAVIPSRNPQDKVNPAIGQADFDSQEERTPFGRIFTSLKSCDDRDPFTLITRIDPVKLPHIYIDCGLQDPFLSLNHEFARLMMERRIPFTYVQTPGEHRSAYWSQAIGPAIAAQERALRFLRQGHAVK